MKKNFILLLIFFILFKNLSAQLNIVSPLSPSTLANFLGGPGVYISNVTTNGQINTSMGKFICQIGCNIGLDSGIILTNGSAAIAGMPNSGTGQGAIINNYNDPDLSTLTTFQIHDACVLEFDFFVVSDSVRFEYVFASEEYSESITTYYMDLFGIFISGPGITGTQNIALIPDTLLPITTNNLNNGFSPSGVPPTGPCNSCAYFLDNTLNSYTTAYDAMTTVLTAKSAVTPCETYHVKIAIGETGGSTWDAGAFIKVHTLAPTNPVCIYANGLPHFNNDTINICFGDSVYLSASPAFNYQWTNGNTTQGFYTSQAGIYAYTINGSGGTCFAFSPFLLVKVDTIIPIPVITQIGTTLYSSVTSPVYSYTWFLNGTIITGANDDTLHINQNGCYVLQVSDTGLCPPTSDTLCVTTININEASTPFFAKLYPNPFHESATLTFENPQKNIFSLTIYDLTGRELRRIDKIQSNSVEIEKKNLDAGIYFYELKEEKSKRAFTGKMVVE